MAIEILEYPGGALLRPEEFIQPDRPIGMIPVEQAKDFFICPERQGPLGRMLENFDKLLAVSHSGHISFDSGNIVRLVAYRNDDDLVRSILSRVKKPKNVMDAHIARAYSIIESSQWGIYGEMHTFETKALKNSIELPPLPLTEQKIEVLFGGLERARSITSIPRNILNLLSTDN